MSEGKTKIRVMAKRSPINLALVVNRFSVQTDFETKPSSSQYLPFKKSFALLFGSFVL